MSHVTHTNESCHACAWVISYIRRSRVAQMRHVTQCMWWGGTLYTRHVAIPIYGFVSFEVDHEFKKVRTLAGRSEPFYSYEWVMSHIRTGLGTHAHESFRINEGVVLHKTYTWVMSHTRTSHVTHAHASFRTNEGVMLHKWKCHVTHSVKQVRILAGMGWLQVVGSLKS